MKAEVGKRYRHWKGHEYTVLAIGRLETDPQKEYVVYRAEYKTADFGEGSVWLRERSVFEEQVLREGKTYERFTDIG